MRKDFKTGGRVGLSRGGGSAPFLRGRSGSSNIKAPRGEAGWRQMQQAEAKIPSKGLKITKGTPIRKEYADLKRAHRLRQKNVKTKERILKERAGRKSSEAFHTKYIKPLSPQAKAKISRSQHPKSWRRAGKS